MAINKRVSTVVANPVRTGVQGGAAWVITELLDSFGILAMDERQYAAVLLGLTLLVGVVQNAVENGIGKGLLRIPAKQTPVVGEPRTTPVIPDGSA